MIAVAIELAAAGGYEAVHMKAVAERSGVALATLYRWFASKDHLLAEVLLDWIARLESDLRAAPLAGSAEERIGALMRAVGEIAESQPGLLNAVTTALLSFDPAVADNQSEFHAGMQRLLDLTLGESDLPGRETAGEILEHVMFSLLVQLARGRESAPEVGERLARIGAFVLRLSDDGARPDASATDRVQAPAAAVRVQAARSRSNDA